MIPLLWTGIIILFAASLIGIIVPVVPEMVLLWSGLLLARFGLNLILPVSFWLGMILISVLVIGSDLFSNIYFVKKYGGSKWAVLGVLVGLIPGMIFLGPAGIFVGPFFMVFIIGLVEGKEINAALKNALGVLTGFFSSTVIKVILELVMIIWFFLLV